MPLFESENMANFDAELKKAFQELQAKVITTTQQVKIAESQIVHLRRNIQHAMLTDQEIGLLPEDTRTYESIGRMFVLKSVSEVRENVKSRSKQADEKIKKLEANKEYLQKSVKEQENSIREMLQQRM